MVILAWNAWEQTRACLESLEPTLGPRDEVIVVDNGSSDATGVELDSYRWLEVISNQVNRGFAPGCNQGAAHARGEFVIFLNNDTVVSDGWIDELLDPFDDPSVGAVGPRSNNVSGAQAIPNVQYRTPGVAGIADFAAAWRKENSGRTSELTRLVGFCLAVRTEAFRRVGGFDEGYAIGGFEDDDLCMKLLAQGLTLLIAHGSYVHHEGHATFDANEVDWIEQQNENQKLFEGKWKASRVADKLLLSVCLIVKNEEEMLGACLESVADLADEIVVYDTGSTDRTVEIAREAGAKVIEGYWDDNFARARNAALEQASGEWVLSIDADETFLSDPQPLRRLLSDDRSDIEAFMVAIENLHGVGSTRTVHTAVRMFRRSSCVWRHRLHEQIGAVDDPTRGLRTSYLTGGRIIHRGYVAEVFASRGKAERNLALAKASLDDGELSRPYALMNYGRALEAAGRSEEAIETLREAMEIADGATTRRVGMMNLIYILSRLQRYDEALDCVGELRSFSTSQIAADIAEGRTRIAMGDNEAGLALLARVPSRGRDDDGMEYAAHMLAALRGEALASLGRFAEAADVVLDTVRTDGVLEADLGELIHWLVKAGRHPSEIAKALEVNDLMPVLARVLRLPPADADAILEGVFERFPDRLEPLAAAGRLAQRLDVARALVWSSRLRQRGLANACPLVTMVNDTTLNPKLRILAGAAAFGTFGECAVVNGVHEARGKLDPRTLEATTVQINRLAPGLLEAEHVDLATPVVVAPAAWSPYDLVRDSRSRATARPVRERAQRGGVNVVGAFESSSLEGEIARCIASALASHNYPVSTTSYDADGRSEAVAWAHRDAGDHPYDTTLLVMSPEDLTNYVMDNGAASFEGRYMIGVWQSEFERPLETMRLTGRMVHEVWAPSKFAVDAIARAVGCDVVRMPIPVGANRTGSPEPVESQATVFLASVDYATGFHRQNPLGVVEAFCAAFAHEQGPRLVFEVAHANRYPSEHRMLLNAVAGRNDIAVLESASGATGRIIDAWSTERSCFVSLHRSEGTGLALARAMLAGTSLIVTSNSFTAEMMGERDSFQVPFTLENVPASETHAVAGDQWAQPDIDQAVLAMRRVADDVTLTKLKARKARERAQRLFATPQSVRVMRNRFSTIEQLRYGNAVSSKRHAAQVVSVTN